jgi:2-keto-4-pentenoate hydratase/2-oxohepta-3-ene-1,7-dioic acid hydratase in catechol pathway
MKLVTFARGAGDERVGLLQDGLVVDLTQAAVANAHPGAATLTSMHAMLLAGDHGKDAARDVAVWAKIRGIETFATPLRQVVLRAPVPRPPAIYCLAGNYAEHWREGGQAAPAKSGHVPQYFMKPVTTITSTDSPIRLPGPLCTAMDYEGELSAIIGREGAHVPAEQALEYVAGYTIFNDISGRKLNIDVPREQNARTGYFDWLSGKWFDTSGPLGPYLAVDEIDDPQKLWIKTSVNGTVRQDASTADMIFTVAEAIAWISRFLTLEPGDVIATGTPSGVGATTDTYLQVNDVVEVEIEGLGTLRNHVVAD